ncbi:MAG: hypothetical protein D6714_12200 [Bacteroidetes bacterium]|nr:MAG: hypothetical protein D6714_12200 [Bacteroidota bacterium]
MTTIKTKNIPVLFISILFCFNEMRRNIVKFTLRQKRLLPFSNETYARKTPKPRHAKRPPGSEDEDIFSTKKNNMVSLRWISIYRGFEGFFSRPAPL